MKIPEDLHFFPLHRPECRTGADSGISVPADRVPPLMRSIFNSLEDRVAVVFRSTGFPWYYANEQAAYIEILRATVLQLLDGIGLKKEDRVEITVASRRISELMGEYGYKNSHDYERSICDNLRGEIADVFSDRSMAERIHITMESARRSLPLAVADLFCGAFRKENNTYLDEYAKNDKVRRFSIHKAFTYLSSRRVPRIRHIFKEDHALGLMLGFEDLAMNPQNQGMGDAVGAMVRKINSDDHRLFENELKSYLDEKLIQDPNRYDNLDFVETFLDGVEGYFNDPGRKIAALIARSRIIISCHRGEVDLKEVQTYLDLLDRHGAEIFNSMYTAAQERLETVLFMVQSAAFNLFRFEAVEDHLSREIERYDLMFPLQTDPIDETRARLEGTIGQMYGFLCDYPEGGVYHDDAEEYLNRDVMHCKKNSPFWVQGMGYLTSFYFKREDLDKTTQSFIEETRSAKSSRKHLFDLSEMECFNSRKNSFFLLHRLYVCVLGLRQNKEITGEEVLKTQLLDENPQLRYPVFLTMKWLGVVHALKNDLENALVLFERAARDEDQGFTIDVIKLPIKIMVHLCRKKLGKRSRFDLNEQLDRLEKKVPGISENLNRLGIKGDILNDENPDFYRLARLMPFYYS